MKFNFKDSSGVAYKTFYSPGFAWRHLDDENTWLFRIVLPEKLEKKANDEHYLQGVFVRGDSQLVLQAEQEYLLLKDIESRILDDFENGVQFVFELFDHKKEFMIHFICNEKENTQTTTSS
jgi:hypothetical protein